MFRSLRSRLLAVSLTVAIVCIGATAWLTTRSTTDRLKGDFQHTLDADGLIYNQLISYAQTHTDWKGVGPTVATLSRQTGRRIALKAPRGPVLADSIILLHEPRRPLPQQPAAMVNPLNPVIAFYGTGNANQPPGPPSRNYPYTPEELASRSAQGDKVAACLTAAGVKFRRGIDDQGLPNFNVNVGDQATVNTYQGCVGPIALDAPSLAEVAADNRDARGVIACLDLKGVHHTDNTDGVGEIQIDVGDVPAANDAMAACVQQVNRTQLATLVAKSVLLYLGEQTDGGLTLLHSSTQRTLTAAGIIMALAVAVTFLASRRILAPVAALTRAARRLAGGDPNQRVAVTGHDEIGQLGAAFNSMASALQATDEQRRSLVSDIAHELRTPLSNLVGYLEAAEDGLVPLNGELVSSLHEEAVLLRRLVDDLQDLALADAGRLRLDKGPVDLADLADQVVVANRQRALSADVTLEVVADSHPVVSGDARRLRQVVGNLVSNAITHTEAGGRVIVRTGTVHQIAELLVIDTGIGIAPEQLPHVFDRFYRTDASRSRDTGGSGLGLAISRQLVDAHHGTIHATSTPGHGSTFILRLPLDAGATSSGDQPGPSEDRPTLDDSRDPANHRV
jgi:two-component system sensor histidine kinase BaeS